MRTVAIIQARMGSSRLPGKVLMPLAGRTVLDRVVRRTQDSGAFDEVMVATTDRVIDGPVASAAADLGVRAVRGDEENVLSRFGLAARESGADAIMRITADCPLIDPGVLFAMAGRFGEGDADLVTNARVRTFPRGLDAELFTRTALETMLAKAHDPAEREHVTPYLYRHPEQFRIVDHVGSEDQSRLRLTLDTAEDYELLQRLFDAAPDPERLGLDDVLALLTQNPDWIEINAGIEQKRV